MNAGAAGQMSVPECSLQASKQQDVSAADENQPVDHNKHYCNICKDGGELLCCDRCPRSFHPICLGLTDEQVDALPEGDWYCPQCTHTLERQKKRADKLAEQGLEDMRERRTAIYEWAKASVMEPTHGIVGRA